MLHKAVMLVTEVIVYEREMLLLKGRFHLQQGETVSPVTTLTLQVISRPTLLRQLVSQKLPTTLTAKFPANPLLTQSMHEQAQTEMLSASGRCAIVGLCQDRGTDTLHIYSLYAPFPTEDGGSPPNGYARPSLTPLYSAVPS